MNWASLPRDLETDVFTSGKCEVLSVHFEEFLSAERNFLFYLGTPERCTSLRFRSGCWLLPYTPPSSKNPCVEVTGIQNNRKLSDLQVTNVLFLDSCPFFWPGPLTPSSFLSLCLLAYSVWNVLTTPSQGPRP